MLSKEQIQCEIVMATQELCGCGSRFQECSIDARVKTLLLVLSGDKHCVGDSTSRIYDIAEIKYWMEGEKV